MSATYQIEQPDGSVYQVEMPEEAPASKPSMGQAIGQVVGNTRLAPLGPPLKDYPATAASFANQAMMGIPKALYEAQPALASPTSGGQAQPPNTRQYPEPSSVSGKLLAAAGTVVPFGAAENLVGQATRMSAPLAAKLAMSPVGQAVERGAVGATAGVLSNVTQPKEYAGRAAFGAAANVAIPPIVSKAFQMFQKAPVGKILNDAEFEQLAGKVRQAVGGAKLAAGTNFDQGITSAVDAKPDVVTPLNDFMDTLKADMKADPTMAEKIQQGMVRSAKQGNTTLQGMFTDESRAASATGRDVQNIKQTLQSVPSIDRALQRTYALQGNPRMGRFDASVSDADLSLIDHINDLKGRLLSAYPELNNEYTAFSNFMNDYRTLAPRLRTGSIESTLLQKYGNPLQRQAASRVLPSEILQQIEQVRGQQQTALEQMQKAQEFKQTLKKLGYNAAKIVGGSVLGGAGIEAGRRLFKQ